MYTIIYVILGWISFMSILGAHLPPQKNNQMLKVLNTMLSFLPIAAIIKAWKGNSKTKGEK